MTSMRPPDLSVVIVSFQEDGRLKACVDSLVRHAGSVETEIVIVANGDFVSTRKLVSTLGDIRYIESENCGYGVGNNLGFERTHARYVLFLNPDIEIVNGDLGDIVERLDGDPSIGVLGVRQIDDSGALSPTIRRAPSVLRTLGDAFGVEHWPIFAPRFAERELRPEAYRVETQCDWVLGSFLLVRRTAFEASGKFDPSFFLFSEEPDLARRVERFGLRVVYSPVLTVRHYGEGAKFDPLLQSQDAYSRLQYAEKHLSAPGRSLIRVALILKYILRLVYSLKEPRWKRASLSALKVLVRLREPPFAARR